MDRRNLLIGAGLLALLPSAPRAEPERLTSDMIDDLLRGRKISGDWNGTPYTQTFEASGRTVYSQSGRPPEEGRWRVNSEDDTYESWWERSGWSSYPIERDGDRLFWIDGSGKKHPFQVLEN